MKIRKTRLRLKIIKETSERLDKKGIWVLDRGNDDKSFFNDLRHLIKVEFIARLKLRRQLVIIKTG